MPQKICLTTLVLLLAAGCGRSSPKPTLTGGVWVVSVADRESAVGKVTTMPYPYGLRYKSIGDYRDFLHQQIGNTRFEFFPDGTAKCSGGWFNNDNLVWRQDGPGEYWVMTRPSYLPVASIGHGLTLNADGTATCKFQVEWNENSATRVPLTMRKRSTP